MFYYKVLFNKMILKFYYIIINYILKNIYGYLKTISSRYNI